MPKENPFATIASNARATTNAALQDELVKHVSLTESELARLLPTKGDKETFAKLMAVVTSASSRNNKLAALESNMKDFGGIVLKLLAMFA